MKVTIKTKKFREYLDQAITAASSVISIPILQSVYVNIGEESFIRTFNGELGMNINITDAVESMDSAGNFLLQGKKILQVLSLDNSQTITLEFTRSDRIIVRGDTSTYNVATLSPEQYPTVDFQAKFAIEVNMTEFRKAVNILIPFIAHDSSRMHMQGVLLDFIGEDWFLVAGDGTRMARIKFKNNGSVVGDLPSWLLSTTTGTYRFTIPDNLLKCVMKMNEDPILAVGFSTGEDAYGKEINQIIFRNGNIDVKGVALVEEFPDWVTVFKTLGQTFDSNFVVDRTLLDSACKKSKVGATRISDPSLYFSTSDDGLILTNREALFMYNEILPITSSDRHGEIETFCTNPDFIIDATSGNLETKSMKFLYNSTYPSAILIDVPEESFRALLMLKRVPK